ncbi:MAG TPA: sugar phosphate isomerase/epimerase [Armatimonadetes bacterium]|nr:sugar phosphate isomerase/epimerase [Armatimonadota bacterium]
MSQQKSRRKFLRETALLVAGAAVGNSVSRPGKAIEPFNRSAPPGLKLSCAAYSYRQFLAGRNKTMTLEDFVVKCAQMGLEGVELTSYYFPRPVTTEYLHRLKRHVFLLGLEVSATSVGNNFCLPPGGARDKQIAYVKQWIDYAVEFGAPCIRIFAGQVPQGHTEEEARRWTGECIEECCAHAARRGVLLALENHGGLTSTAEGLLAIVQAVQSEWFGVNLDTGNFRTPDPYADIAKVAPYAITVHLKTEIAPRGQPRQEADFARIVNLLRQANYRGYLALEYEAAESPLTAVPRHIETLRQLVG